MDGYGSSMTVFLGLQAAALAIAMSRSTTYQFSNTKEGFISKREGEIL